MNRFVIGMIFLVFIGAEEKSVTVEVGTTGEVAEVSEPDWLALRTDIENLVREHECHPILIRLSWHDSGTYDESTGTGGPRAVMRHTNKGEATYGANAGLQIARDLLEPIKQKYGDAISYADLWAFSAVVAIKETGGPDIPFHPGRVDAESADESVPDGRLPDGDKGADHLRHIFYRMGFSDQEIVALSGAHTLGACHADRSGFEGPWTGKKLVFNNGYFKALFKKKMDAYKS